QIAERLPDEPVERARQRAVDVRELAQVQKVVAPLVDAVRVLERPLLDEPLDPVEVPAALRRLAAGLRRGRRRDAERERTPLDLAGAQVEAPPVEALLLGEQGLGLRRDPLLALVG